MNIVKYHLQVKRFPTGTLRVRNHTSTASMHLLDRFATMYFLFVLLHILDNTNQWLQGDASKLHLVVKPAYFTIPFV
eukprot:scaffold24_cov341-Pavlova_lutheri.AAC.88